MISAWPVQHFHGASGLEQNLPFRLVHDQRLIQMKDGCESNPSGIASTLRLGATTGTYAWGFQFADDAWPNLRTITPEPPRPGCGVNTLALTINSANKTVDTGFNYDAAGN